jgi:hypothetical protein
MPAFGWWAESHQIIAAIATQRLNPKAKAAIAAVLPEGQTLESIAPWADDIKKERKETSAWHYINIPPDAPEGDWTRYCPEKRCVAAAIRETEGVLRNTVAPRAQREEALRFLVHLVGDMHQPLHVGERHDHGGNLVRVTFEGRVMTLHAAWDGVLLETWFKLDPSAKMKLREGAPEGERAALAAGTLSDWLWQSQKVSGDAVYGPLDRCRCTELDEAYFKQAIPVLRLQLLRAGERLGRVLNETVGD